MAKALSNKLRREMEELSTKKVVAKKVPAKKVAAKPVLRETRSGQTAGAKKPAVKKAPAKKTPPKVGRSGSVSGVAKPDGGKPEAIQTAAENAAAVFNDPKLAEAPKDPKQAARVNRIVHTMKLMSLPDKLIQAATRAGDVFQKVGQERTRDLWHIVHYFEQWFQLIEREIRPIIDSNNPKLFDEWCNKAFPAMIEDGEYVKLTFPDGTRGIALGTMAFPVVLREVQHEFLAQMKRFNPSFAETMKQEPEFQHTLIISTNIPKELLSLMGTQDFGRAGQTLNMTTLYSVFGSPLLSLVPTENGLQYNLADRMKLAKSFLTTRAA